MKVMCINEENQWWDWFTGKRVDGPEYSEVCTVTRQYNSVMEGELCYDLAEYPPTSFDDGFCARCFIPLSEIDEMEMKRNYDEMLVKVEK